MAPEAPKEGKGGTGVLTRGDTYIPQVWFNGRYIYLAPCKSAVDAAKSRDRAAYKLKGTERGLNFPLTTAEKAELDSVSEAAYLASVQVEKEKLSWLRTKGKSKFRGVETRRNGQWGTKWSRKIFTSEEEAAAEFDRGYLEEMGPTAMTNAKYHADLETRERAWEERRQALEKAFESGTGDLSLRSYKGVFRTSQGWAAKVQIRGNCLRSTVYDTRKEAAECYDRLAYKLLGPSTRLNFGLSPEVKAELDRRSMAEHIAEIHVDKERRLWARKEAEFRDNMVSSRYMGVSFIQEKQKWKADCRDLARASHLYKFFGSEGEAAAWYDTLVVDKLGATAMTNAKYWGEDPGRRDDHWRERQEDVARRLQAEMDNTGKPTGKAQLGKLPLWRIGRSEGGGMKKEQEVETVKRPGRQLPPPSRSPNPRTVETPQSSQQGPSRRLLSTQQTLQPLYVGRIPPQRATLPSPLVGRRDSDWGTSVKPLYGTQEAGRLLEASRSLPAAQHAQAATITPALHHVTSAEPRSPALDRAWSPEPGGGEGGRPWPHSPWADAGGLFCRDLPDVRVQARGGSLSYRHAAWPPEAISTMSSGYGQLVMIRAQVGVTALPRSKLSRLAVPVTGGLLCWLAARTQWHR